MVDHARLPIPPALRSSVLMMLGYHAENVPRSTHVGLPAPEVVVVIDLADGIVLRGPGETAPTSRHSAVSGLSLGHATIHQDQVTSGIYLALTPLGTRTLLRTPVAEITDRTLDLADLVGSEANRLHDQLLAAGRWRCLDVLAGWLLRRLPEQQPDNVALQTWGALTSGRYVRVDALAQDLGWSLRYLHQQLVREVGLGPKAVMRLQRFMATRDDVAAQVPLAEVAARHGYADQAHLAREWRELAGMSPSAWFRNETEGLGL